jgi:hypothetical protein
VVVFPFRLKEVVAAGVAVVLPFGLEEEAVAVVVFPSRLAEEGEAVVVFPFRLEEEAVVVVVLPFRLEEEVAAGAAVVLLFRLAEEAFPFRLEEAVAAEAAVSPFRLEEEGVTGMRMVRRHLDRKKVRGCDGGVQACL